MLKECYLESRKDPRLRYTGQRMLDVYARVGDKDGAAALAKQVLDDAEPLLLQGYQGMKQREKTIPPSAQGRNAEAVDGLIELYGTRGKPVEQKKWQEERAKIKAAEAK